MKAFILNLIFTSLLITDCGAQKLEVKFYPAFHNNSIGIFYCYNDSCGIELKIYDRHDSSKIIWSEKRYLPRGTFKKYMDFFADVEKLCDENVIGLDGITVKGEYVEENEIKRFNFWSPSKGTKKHELFKMTVATLRKYMKAKKSKAYLRRLNLYLK